jgi:hypothetical protein
MCGLDKNQDNITAPNPIRDGAVQTFNKGKRMIVTFAFSLIQYACIPGSSPSTGEWPVAQEGFKFGQQNM